MAAFCLSIHAGYRCARTGACCTAGWPIPIEPERAAALRARGVVGNERGQVFVRLENQEDGGIAVAKAATGACVLYEGGACSIQRDAGPELMPSACRTFPRIALADARGTFVTLSHFCPTAAGLLLSAGEIDIVEAPPAISLDNAVEGLDATAVMPPLLRPGMLTDLDGYAAWEREGIAVLNTRAYSPRIALDIIREATRIASDWRPGDETLAARMIRAFHTARASRHAPGDNHCSLDHPIKAFLAAHLFANWAAYQEGGLLAAVDYLYRVLDLLMTEMRGELTADAFLRSVRAVDLALRHRTSAVPSALSDLP